MVHIPKLPVPDRRRFLEALLADTLGVVAFHSGKDAYTTLAELSGDESKVVPVESPTEFWAGIGTSIRPGNRVTICGALSLYAPVLVDSPQRKRDLHREFRRLESLQTNKEIDSLLAVSAGQMVVRHELPKDPESFVYLGLYHSIVRNSIPVLVKTSYYRKAVEDCFEGREECRVIEAKVTGIVQRLSGGPLDRLHALLPYKLHEPIAEALETKGGLSGGGCPFVLVVNGRSDTSVKKVNSKPRYLDGDIWVAVNTGSEEHLLSRFVDLANPQDVAEQSEALRKDARPFLRDGKVIMEFDAAEPMFGGEQLLSRTAIERYGREVLGSRGESAP